jgi:chromosome segregation ATPase
MNLDVGDIFGQYTVHEAKRLEDEFHSSPLQDRAVTRFVSGVEQRNQGYFNGTLTDLDAQLHERYEILDDRAIELKEDTQKVTRRLESGRLTAAEARKEITRIGTAKRELSERAEQLRRDDAALQEMAAIDPADWEADMLQKYPALRRRLPALTPGYLNQP